MIKIKYLTLLAIIVLLSNSCKQNGDITRFDNKNAYIYFAYPNPNPTKRDYIDSVYFNFSVDTKADAKDLEVKIPIKIGGLVTNQDRKYAYQILQESDFESSLVNISEPIIRKGHYEDTLTIILKRGVELAQKEMLIALELQPNGTFQLGEYKSRKMKIAFTDILQEPSWWRGWVGYFGSYRKEVYQKWIEIYPEGVDPTGRHYWNNMPSSPYPVGSQPVIVAYVGILKNYFEENVVYPDGDTTKARILLP